MTKPFNSWLWLQSLSIGDEVAYLPTRNTKRYKLVKVLSITERTVRFSNGKYLHHRMRCQPTFKVIPIKMLTKANIAMETVNE